jgi:hypothetical protein
MSPKQKEENGTIGPSVAELAAKARPVREFTDVWIGSDPISLGLDPDSKDSVDLDLLVGKEIVVFGFNKRKGDTGPFMICTFAEKGGNKAAVLVTGAAVIVRKLEEVAEKDGLPVVGKITKTPSKQVRGGHYYNFS